MSLDLFTFDSIIAKELEPMKWAVPGMFPQGFSIVAAKQKTGKSFFMLGVGIDVASGTPVLGSIPVEQQEVIYMALEDGDHRIQGRGKPMLRPRFEDKVPGLYIGYHMRPLDDGGYEDIVEALDAHPKVGLFIIDILSRVENNRKGVDLRTEIYRQYEPLQRLGLERGVAFVGVHHMNRRNTTEEGDAQDRIYGSGGYAQLADAIIMIDRKRGSELAKLSVSGRDIQDKEYTILFDWDTRTWSITSDRGEVEAVTMPAERAKLLLAIRETDGKTSPKELAVRLEKSVAQVYKLIHDAKEAGAMWGESGDYHVRGMREEPERELVASGFGIDEYATFDDDYDED